MDNPIGKELVLDIKNCDTNLFIEESLVKFMYELCSHIRMRAIQHHVWEYKNEHNLPKEESIHYEGFSIVLFLLTSNITLHSWNEDKKISLNVFSCSDFTKEEVEKFCLGYFKGEVIQSYFISRY